MMSSMEYDSHGQVALQQFDNDLKLEANGGYVLSRVVDTSGVGMTGDRE